MQETLAVTKRHKLRRLVRNRSWCVRCDVRAAGAVKSSQNRLLGNGKFKKAKPLHSVPHTLGSHSG